MKAIQSIPTMTHLLKGFMAKTGVRPSGVSAKTGIPVYLINRKLTTHKWTDAEVKALLTYMTL